MAMSAWTEREGVYENIVALVDSIYEDGHGRLFNASRREVSQPSIYVNEDPTRAFIPFIVGRPPLTGSRSRKQKTPLIGEKRIWGHLSPDGDSKRCAGRVSLSLESDLEASYSSYPNRKEKLKRICLVTP